MRLSQLFKATALVAALVSLAFGGSASATQLTGAGGAVLGVGTSISASNEGTVELHAPGGTINCKKSTIGGKVTNAGSSTTTVSGTLESLTFTECNATVTVLQKGSFEVHTRTTPNNNNGTWTPTGTEITTLFLGFHCIWKETTTSTGTEVTSSYSVGGFAYWHYRHKTSRSGGSSGAFCGAEGEWTGSYRITSPSTLNIH